VTGNFQHPSRFVDAHHRFLGDFFDGGFSAESLREDLARGSQPAHCFNHVHRYADGPGVVRYRAGNRLANPPCRVGAEFVTSFIFVFVNGSHQPGIALLNKV
jgi:hypothetical protein